MWGGGRPAVVSTVTDGKYRGLCQLPQDSFALVCAGTSYNSETLAYVGEEKFLSSLQESSGWSKN